MFGPRNLYTTIQRNKQSFYIGSALFLILCTFLYGPSFRTPYGLKEEKQSPSGTGSYDASRLTNGGYTRLITGVNGFYSFENVYVRDRTLCEFLRSHLQLRRWCELTQNVCNQMSFQTQTQTHYLR
jgi:hypothetical protein